MDRSSALESLARDLAAQNHHSASELGALLRRPIDIDDVARWIQFDASNYTRRLVACGDNWELRLLCWRPGQSSSLHAHSTAACAFRVVRGSARETVLGARDRVWAPGDVIEESQPELVHQVANAGNDALLTLHCYSPRLPIDSPSPRAGRNIVIVGAGVSGVAVAIHLLRNCGSDVRISLVERGPLLGRGIAYGVDSAVFRLNVPASRMSLDPMSPNDFVTWAGAQETPDAFLSRARFGCYVVDRFRQSLRESVGKLRVVRGDALSIDSGCVHLRDGTYLPADAVVLATGIEPRIAPSQLIDDERIIDAWDECALATLPTMGRILILGSGLTALDVISLMASSGFRGQATVMSRRGLVPRPHLHPPRPGMPLSPELRSAAPTDLRKLLRWGRIVVRDFEAQGLPWQLAIDALRPHLTAIWQGLPPPDRRRFVRSVRPFWDVLRHRAPGDAIAVIDNWRSQGRLQITAGTVVSCERDAGCLAVDVRLSGGGRRREHYDAIVRCIGPAIERSEVETVLVRHLIESGDAAEDPAHLGIQTDTHGRVIRANGAPSERLFAIGPLRRASAWETTSVPDISVHAHALAMHLLQQ